MEPPAIGHRRAFLAPLWLGLLAALLAALLVVGFGLVLYHSAGTTLVLLLRPGDKDPGTIADPPLSPEGEERAQRLARLLGETRPGLGLDAIYVTGDQRAQQTAAPLAARLQRHPTVFAADQAGALAGMLHEHVGGAVLVIAGEPAFTQMLQALGSAQTPGAGVDGSEVIYVVSIPSFGRARLVRLHP
jgi:phosphohistidine phosphatase SixA